MDAIFVTARLKSTRLPKKVLLDIKGRPLISYQIDRLRQNCDAKVIICTSTNSQDDPLENFATENGVSCYRGSEEDVLSRYLCCAQEFSVDRAYILYADEPFPDIALIKVTFDQLNKDEKVWVRNDHYPDGVFGYGLTYSALKLINLMKSSKDNEVWGDMVSRMPINIIVNSPPYTSEKYAFRLTVDYPEDLTVMERLIEVLGDRHRSVTIPELLNLYQNLSLYSVNGHRAADYLQRLNDQAVI